MGSIPNPFDMLKPTKMLLSPKPTERLADLSLEKQKIAISLYSNDSKIKALNKGSGRSYAAEAPQIPNSIEKKYRGRSLSSDSGYSNPAEPGSEPNLAVLEQNIQEKLAKLYQDNGQYPISWDTVCKSLSHKEIKVLVKQADTKFGQDLLSLIEKPTKTSGSIPETYKLPDNAFRPRPRVKSEISDWLDSLELNAPKTGTSVPKNFDFGEHPSLLESNKFLKFKERNNVSEFNTPQSTQGSDTLASSGPNKDQTAQQILTENSRYTDHNFSAAKAEGSDALYNTPILESWIFFLALVLLTFFCFYYYCFRNSKKK